MERIYIFFLGCEKIRSLPSTHFSTCNDMEKDINLPHVCGLRYADLDAIHMHVETRN